MPMAVGQKMVGGGDAFIVVGRFAKVCTRCDIYHSNRNRKHLNCEKQHEFLISTKISSFKGLQNLTTRQEASGIPSRICFVNIHSRKGTQTESHNLPRKITKVEDEQFPVSTLEVVLEGRNALTKAVSENGLEGKETSNFSHQTVTRSTSGVKRVLSPKAGSRVSKKLANLPVVEANGNPVPFSSFQLSQKILDLLAQRGFQDATPIQSATFKIIHDGKDVIGRSRTGTGKTLAFVLPIMQKLVDEIQTSGDNRYSRIQCLVLAPTRELAKQVEQEFLAFAKCFRLHTSCFFGGSSYEVQQRAINRGIDILVATPGRLIDHLERGNIDLSKVKFLILDEADEMLSMGFAEDIEKILTYLPPKNERQTLLFSATVPPWIQELAKTNQNNPIIVDAIGNKDTKTSTTVEHIALRVPATEVSRRLILESVISVYNSEASNFRCIVFARTKAEVDALVCSGRLHNGSAQALHGDITQKQREITLSKFREGSFQVLVATDVAARGLDISGVDLVIQYRIPDDVDMYIHRAGRTGRAGRQGTCIVLYTDDERNKLTQMENICKIRFRLESPPSVQRVMETKANGILRATEAVDRKAIEPLVPIVKEYIENLHVEEEEQREKHLPVVIASLLAVAMGELNTPQMSLLSGEENMCPILVKSKTVLTVSYIVRVVSRLLEEKGFDSRIGLVSIATDPKVGVFDLRKDIAESFVRVANKTMESSKSQSHLLFEICDEIPPLLEPNNTKYVQRKREYSRRT